MTHASRWTSKQQQQQPFTQRCKSSIKSRASWKSFDSDSSLPQRVTFLEGIICVSFVTMTRVSHLLLPVCLMTVSLTINWVRSDDGDIRETCDSWRERLDTLAAKLMVASFKESNPPDTLDQYNSSFCDIQLPALTDASVLGEKCPSPSERKFYSLFKEAMTSHLSMACEDYDGMRDTFEAYKSFSPDAWKQLQGLFDNFIYQVELIRDTVADNHVKMPLACCAFNSYLSEFENKFQGKLGVETFTLNDVVVDFVYDSSETMKKPLEPYCAGYYERDNYRCEPLIQQHPVNISSSSSAAKAQSKSILIPLLDIISQAAPPPARDWFIVTFSYFQDDRSFHSTISTWSEWGIFCFTHLWKIKRRSWGENISSDNTLGCERFFVDSLGQVNFLLYLIYWSLE